MCQAYRTGSGKARFQSAKTDSELQYQLGIQRASRGESRDSCTTRTQVQGFDAWTRDRLHLDQAKQLAALCREFGLPPSKHTLELLKKGYV